MIGDMMRPILEKCVNDVLRQYGIGPASNQVDNGDSRSPRRRRDKGVTITPRDKPLTPTRQRSQSQTGNAGNQLTARSGADDNGKETRPADTGRQADAKKTTTKEQDGWQTVERRKPTNDQLFSLRENDWDAKIMTYDDVADYLDSAGEHIFIVVRVSDDDQSDTVIQMAKTNKEHYIVTIQHGEW
mmetsp:Transcript_98848/g.316909  ORF Transcript_98848/g.316909 Transcript_98848/m.316909 type:complete len:186 (+) Transcript_98848:3-560(+)